MTSSSLPRFCLTMLFIVVIAQIAPAGEKIQFSTGKAKDSKKNSLAVEQTKPALQTLDFTRMGGRGSKAEEMAPITRPPELSDQELDEIERKEKKKKRDDREWLTPEQRAADTDSEAAREEEMEKATGREEIKPKFRDDKNSKDAENRQDKGKQAQRFEQQQESLLNRAGRQDNNSPFNSSGSSTNRILFGSSNRSQDQPFRAEQAPGAPVRELGHANSLSDNSRAATLEKLGIGSRPTGSADSGFKPVTGISPGMADMGPSSNVPRATAGNQLDPLGRAGAGRIDNPVGSPVSGPSLRTGFINDPAPLGMGLQSSQPRAFDPQQPLSVRKPAVLPVPQRKF